MLPIIGLALQYAPALIGLLVGDKAKDVTNSVIGAAKEVFGTDDPGAIEAQIAADKSKADQFIAKLQSVTDQFKIAVEDTQSARQQTVQLNSAGSPLAWGAAVVSVLVTLGFIGCLWAMMTVKFNFTETTGQVFLILVGTLASAFTQVINYWLGSSAGSANKDALIAAMTPSPVAAKKK